MVKMSEQELWELVKRKLTEQGIDFTELLEIVSNVGEAEVKVVCATGDLSESIEELGAKNRDQVVMVRVDSDTTRRLDMWTETGAIKSRSEAAALFIREGLKGRESELSKLEGAIEEVQKAKAKLRGKAKSVFGEGTNK